MGGRQRGAADSLVHGIRVEGSMGWKIVGQGVTLTGGLRHVAWGRNERVGNGRHGGQCQ